ncbi:MAG TPA: hypothetical protein VM580_15725 [Labilithrix sp.]|nr:hypothetical protein [Labilithrix sp.]
MTPSALGPDLAASMDVSPARKCRAITPTVPASKLNARNLGDCGSPPRSTRLPGMHLGHEVLLAMTLAVALLATLLLNAAHG